VNRYANIGKQNAIDATTKSFHYKASAAADAR